MTQSGEREQREKRAVHICQFPLPLCVLLLQLQLPVGSPAAALQFLRETHTSCYNKLPGSEGSVFIPPTELDALFRSVSHNAELVL